MLVWIPESSRCWKFMSKNASTSCIQTRARQKQYSEKKSLSNIDVLDNLIIIETHEIKNAK